MRFEWMKFFFCILQNSSLRALEGFFYFLGSSLCVHNEGSKLHVFWSNITAIGNYFLFLFSIHRHSHAFYEEISFKNLAWPQWVCTASISFMLATDCIFIDSCYSEDFSIVPMRKFLQLMIMMITTHFMADEYLSYPNTVKNNKIIYYSLIYCTIIIWFQHTLWIWICYLELSTNDLNTS